MRIDKGAGIRHLLADSVGADIDTALYVGDDSTDLDAFRTFDERWRAEGRLTHVVCVGVASDEGPSEITGEADVVVDGPEGVRELLALLAAQE